MPSDKGSFDRRLGVGRGIAGSLVGAAGDWFLRRAGKRTLPWRVCFAHRRDLPEEDAVGEVHLLGDVHHLVVGGRRQHVRSDVDQSAASLFSNTNEISVLRLIDRPRLHLDHFFVIVEIRPAINIDAFDFSIADVTVFGQRQLSVECGFEALADVAVVEGVDVDAAVALPVQGVCHRGRPLLLVDIPALEEVVFRAGLGSAVNLRQLFGGRTTQRR